MEIVRKSAIQSRERIWRALRHRYFTPECDWCAGDIAWHDDATEFRVAYRGNEVARIRIPIAGRHNVLDALAAIALSQKHQAEA